MSNTYTYEPKSPISGSAILANAGIYKRENKRNWATAQNLPWQVAAARAEAAAKEKIAEIKESFRREPAKSVFLVARRQKGNTFKAIGFLEEFSTFEALKAFARGIGRQKIRMGAIVASV